MKRVLSLIFLSLFLILPWNAFCEQVLTQNMVAEVTLDKGLLNVRKDANNSASILDRLPDGMLVLVLEKGEDFCRISFDGREGYAMAKFLTFVHVPKEALSYRLLKKDDSGDDVVQLKQRLTSLGYYREGATITNVYNDTCIERIKIFQRVHGLTEDGVATQMLQYLLYSDQAKANTEPLPAPKKSAGFVYSDNGANVTNWDKFIADHPGICTCCMGAGCECCNYTGYIN